VTAFASALSQHPIAATAVGEAAGELLEQLNGEGCDLAVCFASTHHVGAFEDIGPALREILEPSVLVGGTAVAVVGGPHEVEENPALTVFAARLAGATLTPVTLRVQETPDGTALTGWPSLERPPASLLLFADPFTFPVDAFLQRVNRDLPGLQIIGGLASAAGSPGGNRLVLDDHVVDEGAVGVFVDGGIEVRTLVSQGCRPIGRPFVVTRAEQNLIEELGGKPAIEAVGEHVSVGQTVQFHVRDAGAADEDLREMLSGVDADAALLFTCNGRGRNLFSVPDHDAGMVENLLGPIPLAGAFCAGEIGPVGGRNFLHGFTASLALFA
jgi:small ligand-binding sensory domain FIST